MKKILIIGFVWPEPTSSAAGVRMMQLIEFFQVENYSIHFASTASKTTSSVDLEALQIDTSEILLNHHSFDEFILKLNPDVVMFDRFMCEEQFGWRVTETCPEAIRILNPEDLHFLRKGREEAFKQNVEFNLEEFLNDYAKRELAGIYRCDLSFIISDEEMAILKHHFNIDESLLEYVPFMFPELTDSDIDVLPAFDDRKDFVTIGNFRHPPNLDAVRYLKQQIWPMISAKLPDAKMHVFGSYPNQEVMGMTNKSDRFVVHGKAKDVNEVMQKARICLAPLRFGAGLKGKVVDAYRNGTPCIMSKIAAEGIFTETEDLNFVQNTPEIFAEKAVEYYMNKDKWLKVQDAGFKILNSEFKKDAHYKRLRNRLDDLFQNIDKHRRQNIIGQILNHHTMQSTKYLSRWIELKNR